MDPLYFIAVAAGVLVGFVLAYIWRGKEMALERKSWEERKAIWEQGQQAREQLEASFKAIAGDVLRTHSKDFSIKAADSEKNVATLVEEIRRTMRDVENKVSDYEKNSEKQIGSLTTGIRHVLDVGTKMQDTALSLKSVLSSASGVRGRWGEAVLKNILEESGLTEGIDYTLQTTITGEESAKLRPDVIVNLPGNLHLAIDSKAGLEAFFKAVEEKDEAVKRQYIEKFVQDIRGHIGKLASKEYQSYLDVNIPYVVMFIPGEAAVRAAFECDADLYHDAQAKKIMLASPATIIPLVLLIAHAWKQQKSAENATEIIKSVADLGTRIKTFVGHMNSISASLSAATKTFNAAIGSWDLRVRPQVEKINALASHALIEETELRQIEEQPRLTTGRDELPSRKSKLTDE